MTITKYSEGEIYSKVTAGKDGYKGSIAIVFIHAAIVDGSMWDAQVQFLTTKGIICVQYDILGFGSSNPNQDYLKSDPRPKIDHMKHILDLIEQLKSSNNHSITKIVVAGLSMGGAFALQFATMHPDLVDGVAVAAGYIPGYEPESWPKEEQDLDDEIEAAIENGEIAKAAKLQVHYWGDGPLQKEGRCASDVRDRLYKWSFDVSQRRFNKTGGSRLPRVSYPPITQQVLEGLNIPVAVAMGRFDETVTNVTMEYLAKKVKDVDVRTFDTAHMINLEHPDEFNDWLYNWIGERIVGY